MNQATTILTCSGIGTAIVFRMPVRTRHKDTSTAPFMST